jgi:hypothetical protein
MRNFQITTKQGKLLVDILDDRKFALDNWIATAIEMDRFADAKEMVEARRTLDDLRKMARRAALEDLS